LLSKRPLAGSRPRLIRAEKKSGKGTRGRAQVPTALDFIGKGDVLLVTRVDRLERSIGDLQDMAMAEGVYEVESRPSIGPRRRS
jgi:hypothetical protein